MLTLKDLAAHVGVSPSAVSLVLNDRHAGRVNESTAERIRSAAEEMGYVPNLLARGLKTRRTHTFGLISDGVASVPFAGPMLAGVQDTAWAAGYLALLIDTTGDADLEAPSVRSLLQRDVEALIVATQYHRHVTRPVVPPTMPLVLLDGVPENGDEPVDSVIPDEAGGAYAAVRHLVHAGHRRIALCNVSDETYIASRLRREGYERALREAGIEPDPALAVEVPLAETPAAVPAARALLDRAEPPTAVFCFADKLAFAFYQVAHQLGMSVPEDLSVVGFDNQPYLAEALLPGLTTVQLPHYDMGTWAAGRAIARIRGDDIPPERRLMPCPLVERDSVRRLD
jgi:LacI family transcriptional regulator